MLPWQLDLQGSQDHARIVKSRDLLHSLPQIYSRDTKGQLPWWKWYCQISVWWTHFYHHIIYPYRPTLVPSTEMEERWIVENIRQGNHHSSFFLSNTQRKTRMTKGYIKGWINNSGIRAINSIGYLGPWRGGVS